MRSERSESGYAMIGVLLLLTLSGAVIVASLKLSASNARTLYAGKKRSGDFYLAEESVSRTVSWMRLNSQSIISPFSRDNFYTYFTRTAFSTATNDGTDLQVPTGVKLASGGESVILTNDSALGTGAFPYTINLTTSAIFDAVNEFAGGYSRFGRCAP